MSWKSEQLCGPCRAEAAIQALFQTWVAAASLPKEQVPKHVLVVQQALHLQGPADTGKGQLFWEALQAAGFLCLLAAWEIPPVA